jgi:hypothetical protein
MGYPLYHPIRERGDPIYEWGSVYLWGTLFTNGVDLTRYSSTNPLNYPVRKQNSYFQASRNVTYREYFYTLRDI